MRYLFTLWVLCIPLTAATYPATSCSIAHIQAAITAQQVTPVDGDIITVPAGTCTWTGATQVSASFTTSVTIQGAGAVSATDGGASTTGSDVTTIIDNLDHDTSAIAVFSFGVTSGKSFRFTGISILQDASSVPRANAGMLTIAGASTSLRIDHCHLMVYGGAVGIRINGEINGVIDHLYAESPANVLNNQLSFHNGAGTHGDASWADTDHFGSSQFMFVENSRFRNGGVGDAHTGSRYVLRYNTMLADNDSGTGEAQMYNHGLTSNRDRSVRAAEVYANTFTIPGTIGVNHPAFSANGGPVLFWGNIVTQYRAVIQLDYIRRSNSTYFYSPTPDGWGNCDASTVWTAWDGPSSGYPCIDFPGRGAGDLLSGDFPSVVNTRTGTIASPQQVLSPIYLWNNTFTPAGQFLATTALVYHEATMLDNRDFYQQFDTYGEAGSFDGTAGIGQGIVSARTGTCTAGPGGNTPGVGYWATDTTTLYVCNPTNTWTAYYTPYTYPHPLTLDSTGGSTSGGKATHGGKNKHF